MPLPPSGPSVGSPGPRAARVLERLADVHEEAPGRWTAACPAHGGGFPPLTVREARDTRVWFDCPAGCKAAQIVAEIGLHMGDLFPPREEKGRRRDVLELPSAASRDAGMEPGQELLVEGPSRFRVYLDDELDTLPPLEWLVDGVLPAHGFAALIGAPEVGKSFVAIALACAIATGVPWLGRAVNPALTGGVLYVTGEGTYGLRQRVRAWKRRHGVAFGDRLGVGFVTEAPNMLESADASHVARAAATLAETTGAPPSLVVFDTLARTMPGGDENSARDVGLVVARGDAVRRLTGAAILFLHHVKRDSEQERGSGALRGACDTMFLLRGEADDLELVCEKQKEAPHFASLPVVLVPQTDGAGLSSLVADPRAPTRPGDPVALTPRRRDALRTLVDVFGDRGATATEWEKTCTGRGLSSSTFYNARGKLVDGGYVELATRGRAERYVATWEGRHALADRTTAPQPTAAATAPTPAAAPGSTLPGSTLSTDDWSGPPARSSKALQSSTPTDGEPGRPAVAPAPTQPLKGAAGARGPAAGGSPARDGAGSNGAPTRHSNSNGRKGPSERDPEPSWLEQLENREPEEERDDDV